MKRLLIPSFYFPPHYGVKVVRTTKFCKLLPLQGWTPWVLTVDPRYFGGKTTSYPSGDLKNVGFSRIPYLKFPGNTVVMKIVWSFLVLGFVLLHRRDIDAIYMSGSPFYPFPLTLPLTGVLGIPTVIDFRDSWSFNHGYDGTLRKGFRGTLRSLVYGFAEKIAVRYASRVLFSTSVLQDEYAALIPGFDSKYHTITNGIDLDDFSHVVPLRSSEKKTLVLAGQFRIYLNDVVNDFLKCLKSMPDVHFLYLGEESAYIADSARTSGVRDQVTALPFQPYPRALQLIAGADAAVVATGLVNGMGTKIFDYLALNKPVLCLVPEGSIIKRVFGDQASVVVSEAPHTFQKIFFGLQKVLALKDFPSVPLDAYTRQEAARQLADVLDNLVDGASP